ncbi:MAG: hypothetical protein AUJ75_02380 [Candidatus Omnitrophica bacterium CG1_02_49_10]|nr:MAG: hypothetical protein AUJ75_02380 [Candidatus Omnitrophica bacterium CG1_02_49_10]
MNRFARLSLSILFIALIVAAFPADSPGKSARQKDDTYYIAFKFKQAAVIPFADNTHKESFFKALTWRGNGIFTSALIKSLRNSKLEVTDAETVNRILVGRGLIKRMLDINNVGTAQWELARIEHAETIDKKLADKAFDEAGAAEGFDAETVKWFGNRLKVQVIIRGDIEDLGARRSKKSAFPDKVLFPFQGDDGNVIGYADAKSYMIGLKSNPKDSIGTINSVSLPAGDRSAVKVTMYMQNAADASIIWTGSVNVECNYSVGDGIDAAADALVNKMLERFVYYNDNFLHIDSGKR